MPPSSNYRAEPIAVVGSSCRFPGGATSPAKLWSLLKEPRDLLMDIPTSRFNPNGFYHENGEHHGSTNVKQSYFLEDDHRLFDHSFFSIHPKEAESLDPQQRLLLETVYEGIESAGYSIQKLKGSSTAVFVGQMNNDYFNVLMRDIDSAPQYMATGATMSIMSNRVSYFFDWRGPSATIDTACSSSLVALHQAVQSLRNNESQMAVAAGVNLILGPEMYIFESKLHMLSPTGRSRMWDADVDGYARGEGFATVILKTLSQAIADKDHIECIIRETGVNQDGRTKGITMPSASAQAALIRATYNKCGLDLTKKEDRPQYFEAHGTGTPAGDPVEAEAVQSVFFPAGDNPFGEKLHVGSVKTVIGHLEGTAGLAGLLKASLAVQHGIIPPNMLFNQLNPNIEPFYTHLRIPTTLTPWPALPKGVPRRASVNSFGFGGTNAHVIIESWEPLEIYNSQANSNFYCGPFNLSANSKQAITSAATALSSRLKTDEVLNLADLAYTLNRRTQFQYSASFSATDRSQLIEKLDTAVENQPFATRSTPVTEMLLPRILGVFTGQGAQWPTMGAELYAKSTAFRETIRELEDSLNTLPDPPSWSLTQELLAPVAESRVDQATISQPACTAVQIALVDLLTSSGITFSAVVGHSSGEIAAAYAAGYIKASDAIRIAYYRGMHAHLAKGSQGQAGKMMAVGMSIEEATVFCQSRDFAGRISVAASNARSSVTLSGDADAIDEAKNLLDEQKMFARLLKVDTAYHSHHMKLCADPYFESLLKCDIQVQDGSLLCNWYSSVYGPDGRSIRDLEALKGQYWVQNMAQTVLFSQAVQRAVVEEHCHDLVLEIGPHPALKGPTLETLKTLTGLDLPYSGVLKRGANDMNALSDALGFIWKTFLSPSPIVDFDGFSTACSAREDSGQTSILKNLPPYKWDHDKILWKESRRSKAFRTRKSGVHELLGISVSNGQNHEMRWRNVMKLSELEWLRGHVFQNQVLFPAAGYVSMAFEASIRMAGDQAVRLVELQDLTIHRAITLDEESAGIEVTFVIRCIERGSDQITAEYTCYSGDVDGSGQDFESTNFTGRVVLSLGTPVLDALPARIAPKLPMESIDTGRLYSAMSDIGLSYSGDFLVESINRRLNISTVTVKRMANSKLQVHPATLDATFHGIFAAFSWPGDGRLWTTYLPTNIERVRINMSCPNASQHMESGLVADCNVTLGTSKVICGDIDIFCAADGHPEIQVQGLTCTSFTNPGPEDDRKLYSKNVWKRDVSHGIEPDRRAHPDKISAELCELCERASYFFLRKLREEVSREEIPKMEWQFQHLMEWVLNYLLPKIEAGDHPRVKPEWARDKEDMVLQWKDDHPGQIDLEIINAVGKALPSILKGNLSALQILKENDMLGRLYTDGLGFQRANIDLANVVSQLAHRYPRMNILEIGAGTGGATRNVLKVIKNQFSTYTYTDISTGFFPTAQGVFRNYSDSMVYKVLDIEKDPVKQDFNKESYDLIIASNVLHATKSLANTMKNCRSLLKPGGYLMLLEITSDALRPQFMVSTLPGWFHGVKDGRIWAPTISEAQWNSKLLDAGFSGVDTVCRDSSDDQSYLISVMTSQAVDDRVAVLRKPLTNAKSAPQVSNLIILGGEYNQVAVKTRELLFANATNISLIPQLEDIQLQSITIPSGAAVICLSDVEDAKEMTKERFQSIQKIFHDAKYVLWVTQGCRVDNPYANMIIGMGRSILLESRHIQLQFMDLDMRDEPNPLTLAESLLRLVCADLPEYEGILWSNEHEVAFEGEALYIPRVLPNDVLNDRLNSDRRIIKENVLASRSCITITDKNGRLELQESKQDSGLRLRGEKLQIQIKTSSFYPFRTLDDRLVYFCVGSIIGTGKKILTLSPTNSSLLSIPADEEALDWEEDEDDSEQLSRLIGGLLAESLVSGIQGTLWVHQPDESLIPLILEVAGRKGVRVFFTTSVRNSDPRLVFVHPYITTRKLEELIPADIHAYINMQLPRHEPLDDVFRSFIGKTKSYALSIDTDGKRSVTMPCDKLALFELVKTCLSTMSSLKALPASNAQVVTIDQISESAEFIQPTATIKWCTATTIPVKVRPVDQSNLFSANKTYLMIGMTGDLGLSICEWMIDNGAQNIVITSRNPKIHPEVMKKLQRKCSDFRVLSLDIADKEALKKLHQDICATMPPIGGVANAAMVLHDTAFETMSWEDFEVVLGPKVQGSKNLDELFYSTDLDFFLLFSSLACVVGNSGQANYGAANMFMTSLAHQRRKRGVAASIIHIAMLLGVGYVARSVDQYESLLKKYKYMAISESEFHSIFAEAIVCGRPDSNQELEILTGLGADANALWHKNPRFSHYLRDENDIRDSKPQQHQSMANLRSQLTAAESDEEALAVLESGFAKMLELILQITADKIDKDSPLMNLEIDSLVAVEIRSWFLKEVNVDMPVLNILSGTSMADLCKGALARLPDLENESASNSEPVKVKALTTPVANIDWVEEIASLCEGLPAKSLHLNGLNHASSRTGLSVVLTGATGFLGTHILRRLVDDDHVEQVHCLAIRPDSKGNPRHVGIVSPKITEYSGDLSDRLFHLSEQEFQMLSESADIVIHNGANVSFLNNYHAVRQINVLSTKTLVEMAIPRSIPIHLVSTAAVALFSNSKILPEISAAHLTPPTDGIGGYASSKWASEVLLEKVASSHHVPVFIHRAVNVVGEGAPETDLMTVLNKYTESLGAVMLLDDKIVDGDLDVVEVEDVSSGLVAVALATPLSVQDGNGPHKNAEPLFTVVNYCNDIKLAPHEIKGFMEVKLGRKIEEWSMEQWLDKAHDLGLNRRVESFLRDSFQEGRAIKAPSLRKGKL